jgi:hypothetical protein
MLHACVAVGAVQRLIASADESAAKCRRQFAQLQVVRLDFDSTVY